LIRIEKDTVETHLMIVLIMLVGKFIAFKVASKNSHSNLS
jgi:hypothetical protein